MSMAELNFANTILDEGEVKNCSNTICVRVIILHDQDSGLNVMVEAHHLAGVIRHGVNILC